MKTIHYLVISIFTLPLLLSACKSESTSSVPDVAAKVVEVSVADKQSPVNATAHPLVTVYKSPTCGCCKGWVTYLEEEGFEVTAIDHDDVDSIKTKFGLTNPQLKSCHTAIVDGYVIEGHVPDNDIERLLSEKPADIKGLTAPGMPMMSPGMGSRIPKDYAVLSFTESGDSKVYSQY